MASTWCASLVVLTMWLPILFGHSVIGRDLQNVSMSHVDKHAQVAPQMSSNNMSTAEQTRINHWANFRTLGLGQYYGARAILNVYGLPALKKSESTSLEIWVVGHTSKSFNSIQAGWMVDPEEFGDHDTHFFVLWTTDIGYTTGCINFKCKGFVLDNSSQLVPGNHLQPLSKYNREQRYITLKISKDLATGDWWLYSGPDATKPVGYWPKSLFTSLANNADYIHIGGIASFLKGGISPPMGSGLAVTEGEGRAASIKYVRLVDENGSLHVPRKDNFDYYFDRANCYKITGDIENTLYVGGPGGCKD